MAGVKVLEVAEALQVPKVPKVPKVPRWPRTVAVAALAVSAGFVMAGCGEKPQTTTRKADVSPVQGAVPAFTAPGWKPGDAESWEQQMKKRSQGQNEYSRTDGKL